MVRGMGFRALGVSGLDNFCLCSYQNTCMRSDHMSLPSLKDTLNLEKVPLRACMGFHFSVRQEGLGIRIYLSV